MSVLYCCVPSCAPLSPFSPTLAAVFICSSVCLFSALRFVFHYSLHFVLAAATASAAVFSFSLVFLFFLHLRNIFRAFIVSLFLSSLVLIFHCLGVLLLPSILIRLSSFLLPFYSSLSLTLSVSLPHPFLPFPVLPSILIPLSSFFSSSLHCYVKSSFSLSPLLFLFNQFPSFFLCLISHLISSPSFSSSSSSFFSFSFSILSLVLLHSRSFSSSRNFLPRP